MNKNMFHAMATVMLTLLDRVALTPAEKTEWQKVVDDLFAAKPVEVKISKVDLKSVVKDMLASEVKAQLPELTELETLIKTAVAGAIAEHFASENTGSVNE